MLPIDPLLSIRPRGVRVTARLSTVIVLALSAGGAVAGIAAGSAEPGSWFVGTIAVLFALIGALALQALAEFVACRRLGGRVRQIHLLCFGAVLAAGGDDESPRREAVIGVAGLIPLLLLAGGIAGGNALGGDRLSGDAVLTAAAVAVGAVATVQALPALGLGGGRVFRALVWYLTDNALTGARVAAIYAYLVGAGLMALGLGLLGLGGARPYWGLWAIVAGWQLSGTARIDVYRTRWHELARTRTLADVILPTTRISHAATIDAAIEPLLAAGPQAPLLVIGDDAQPIGILRIEDLRGVRRSEWDRRLVSAVLSPIATLPHLAADTPVIAALDLFDDRDAPAIVVTPPGDPDLPLATLTRTSILARLHERRPD